MSTSISGATLKNQAFARTTTIPVELLGIPSSANMNLGTLQDSIAKDIYFPSGYGTITDGGVFGDGLAHPASTNGFATLGALQAVFPFATATSNDMAGLMIQAAIKAAEAATYGGTVPLGSGQYRNLPGGLIFAVATKAKLIGNGVTTVLLCANCGTNPGITVGAINITIGPVSNLALYGMNATVSGSPTAGGAAQTGIYNAGSRGMYFSGNTNTRYEGILFTNFDLAVDWDYASGNYVVTFRDCWFGNNNKAAVIQAPGAAAFEKMTWDGCSLSNNNYGAFLIFQSSTTVGSGASVGGDAYFINCSFDYNFVRAIYYLGLGDSGGVSQNDHQNSVYLNCCHVETDVSTSGSTPRIAHDGDLNLNQVEFFENGANPQGAVSHLGFYARTATNQVKGPGFSTSDVTAVPFIYAPGSDPLFIANTGLANRTPSYTVYMAAQSGMIPANSYNPHWKIIGSNTTLNYGILGGGALNMSATMSATVPPDSASNFIIGTVFTMTAWPGATCTLVAGAGVAVSSTGAGLTFGGANGATIFLTKIAANTWMASGQMT